MLESSSHKDKVLEIYNAEISDLKNAISKGRRNLLSSLKFEFKIGSILGRRDWDFFRAPTEKLKERLLEKRKEKLLDFYQRILPRFDTKFPNGNIEFHGKEVTEKLLTLRGELRPGGEFKKETWEGLEKKFIRFRQDQLWFTRRWKSCRKELKKSVKEIHKVKSDKKLAEILQRDFAKDRESFGPIYTNSFYVDINEIIKGKEEFEQVKDSIKDRVAQAEKGIKESDEKTTKVAIEDFKQRLKDGKITPEKFEEVFESFKSGGVKLKILESNTTQQAVTLGVGLQGSPGHQTRVGQVYHPFQQPAQYFQVTPPPYQFTGQPNIVPYLSPRFTYSQNPWRGQQSNHPFQQPAQYFQAPTRVSYLQQPSRSLMQFQQPVSPSSCFYARTSDNLWAISIESGISQPLYKNVFDTPSRTVTKPVINFGDSMFNGAIWNGSNK